MFLRNEDGDWINMGGGLFPNVSKFTVNTPNGTTLKNTLRATYGIGHDATILDIKGRAYESLLAWLHRQEEVAFAMLDGANVVASQPAQPQTKQPQNRDKVPAV